MNAEGEHRRFLGKKDGVSVPLVHVAVDDQDLANGLRVVSQSHVGRHLGRCKGRRGPREACSGGGSGDGVNRERPVSERAAAGSQIRKRSPLAPDRG